MISASESLSYARRRRFRNQRSLSHFGRMEALARFGDMTDLFTAAYDSVQICTAATGCLDPIDLKSPPDPETHKMLAALQPAIILRGTLGTKTFAPYGMPNGISPEFKSAGVALAIGAGAALIGGILLIRSF